MNYRTAPIIAAKARADALRTERFGPPPTNPFRYLRQSHEFTLDNLCTQAFVSKLALIRLEQGTYDNPLPSVLNWWANHVCKSNDCPANKSAIRPGEPIGDLYIRDAYADFQHSMRIRHSQLFGSSLRFNDNEYGSIINDSVHPFRILRNRVHFSITEVAKALCIPQATLDHFEKRYYKQQTVPKNLRYALHESKYSSDEIAGFNQVYAEFRSNNRRTLIVSSSVSA